VFDASGACLTTIGGLGTNSLNSTMPAAWRSIVPGMYISAIINSRIQKFAPGCRTGSRSTSTGFGDPYSSVSSLENFNGQLYAGTANWEVGGQVWRTSNGINWSAASEPGFDGDPQNATITDLIEFKGLLYASNSWGGSIGHIWRSIDGTDWQPVVEDGFGDPANMNITTFAVFSDTLYAAISGPEYPEIWRSSSGDPLSWTPVITEGVGYAGSGVTGFSIFGDYLYIAIENGGESPPSCQVWRSGDGSSWEAVTTDGFGDPNNISMGGWAILDGYLYIGTLNDISGAQLWRSNDGTLWEPVVQDGFGDLNNIKIESLLTFESYLFAGTQNNVTGLEVWRSPDGTTWSQVNADGFGDSNNYATLWSNATTVFQEWMYMGDWNFANGGEIWRYEPEVSASFTVTPTSGIAPLEVTFTNTSTGTLTANLWDFGDGITSTVSSPTHSYEERGVYTVTLTAGSFGSSVRSHTNLIWSTHRSRLILHRSDRRDYDGNITNPSTGDCDTGLWTLGIPPPALCTLPSIFTAVNTTSA
jgi:hypothetical protein